jgi:hypothetical protein
MFEKSRLLLLMSGLVILFSLGNYVYAQEIQSPCNDGCENQIFNLVSGGESENQIFNLVSGGESANQTFNWMSGGESANQTFTSMDDQIKKLFGSDKSDQDFRYGIDVILKSGQTKWRYSEKDITNLNLAVYLAIICGNELPKKVAPTLQKEKEDVLTLRARTGSEPCNLIFILLRDSGLPTASILVYAKRNLTNIDLFMKIYRYHPEKRHHQGTDQSVLVAG